MHSISVSNQDPSPIIIEKKLLNGFSLNVSYGNISSALITQTITQQTKGVATVHYTATENVYIIISLSQTSTSSQAPARIITGTNEDIITAGAYIYSINIKPKKLPSAIENIHTDNPKNRKIHVNGQLLIIHEGHIYNTMGTRIK